MGFVIATAWGTLGDVLPFVAIGAELRKRRHEVTLIANPAFERLAQQAALSFVAVGTAAEHREFIEDAGLWKVDPDAGCSLTADWIEQLVVHLEARSLS